MYYTCMYYIYITCHKYSVILYLVFFFSVLFSYLNALIPSVWFSAIRSLCSTNKGVYTRVALLLFVLQFLLYTHFLIFVWDWIFTQLRRKTNQGMQILPFFQMLLSPWVCNPNPGLGARREGRLTQCLSRKECKGCGVALCWLITADLYAFTKSCGLSGGGQGHCGIILGSNGIRAVITMGNLTADLWAGLYS